MICTLCGHEYKSLNVFDDETRVCNGCLFAFFEKCSHCGELLNIFTTKFFTLKDGRLICEHCREDFDDGESEDET